MRKAGSGEGLKAKGMLLAKAKVREGLRRSGGCCWQLGLGKAVLLGRQGWGKAGWRLAEGYIGGCTRLAGRCQRRY